MNDNPAKIENDDPLSDLQLEEEQYDRMGSGESGGTGSVPLEEEEETFQITMSKHPRWKNSILPNETSKEYEERKKENDMALDDTDNGIANDKNIGLKDPTDSGVWIVQIRLTMIAIKIDCGGIFPMGSTIRWQQRLLILWIVNGSESMGAACKWLCTPVWRSITGNSANWGTKKSAEETAQLESEIAAAKAKTLEEEAEAKQVTNEDDGNGDLDEPTAPLENENGLPLGVQKEEYETTTPSSALYESAGPPIAATELPLVDEGPPLSSDDKSVKADKSDVTTGPPIDAAGLSLPNDDNGPPTFANYDAPPTSPSGTEPPITSMRTNQPNDAMTSAKESEVEDEEEEAQSWRLEATASPEKSPLPWRTWLMT